jgi:hypothetical protein
MSTALWQYRLNSARRHEGLKEIQGYERFLIFSWVGALILWGLLWWAVFRVLTLWSNALCAFRFLLR